jgi:hypothetical protein
MADLENVGLTRDELAALFNSAETYTRMCERIEDYRKNTSLGGLADAVVVQDRATGPNGKHIIF